MTPREEERDWQRAFVRQAGSDLDVYDLLCQQRHIPSCHRMHYLQMALEKAAKAFAWSANMRDQRSPKWATSHAVAAKVLPMLFRDAFRASERRAPPHGLVAGVRQLCREIELLAPAVDDDGRRPDNCEYPWAEVDGSGAVVAIRCPVDHDFLAQRLLEKPEAKHLLKIVRAWLCEHA